MLIGLAVAQGCLHILARPFERRLRLGFWQPEVCRETEIDQLASCLSRLREKKESLSEAELREAKLLFDCHMGLFTQSAHVGEARICAASSRRREHIQCATASADCCKCVAFAEGWTVLHFLEKMEFGDGAEDVANLFERGSERGRYTNLQDMLVWHRRHWKDFISMSARDIMRIPVHHLAGYLRSAFASTSNLTGHYCGAAAATGQVHHLVQSRSLPQPSCQAIGLCCSGQQPMLDSLFV